MLTAVARRLRRLSTGSERNKAGADSAGRRPLTHRDRPRTPGAPRRSTSPSEIEAHSGGALTVEILSELSRGDARQRGQAGPRSAHGQGRLRRSLPARAWPAAGVQAFAALQAPFVLGDYDVAASRDRRTGRQRALGTGAREAQASCRSGLVPDAAAPRALGQAACRRPTTSAAGGSGSPTTPRQPPSLRAWAPSRSRASRPTTCPTRLERHRLDGVENCADLRRQQRATARRRSYITAYALFDRVDTLVASRVRVEAAVRQPAGRRQRRRRGHRSLQPRRCPTATARASSSCAAGGVRVTHADAPRSCEAIADATEPVRAALRRDPATASVIRLLEATDGAGPKLLPTPATAPPPALRGVEADGRPGRPSRTASTWSRRHRGLPRAGASTAGVVGAGYVWTTRLQDGHWADGGPGDRRPGRRRGRRGTYEVHGDEVTFHYTKPVVDASPPETLRWSYYNGQLTWKPWTSPTSARGSSTPRIRGRRSAEAGRCAAAALIAAAAIAAELAAPAGAPAARRARRARRRRVRARRGRGRCRRPARSPTWRSRSPRPGCWGRWPARRRSLDAAGVAILLHRAPLALLVLTYPGRRLRGTARAAIALAALLAPFAPGRGASPRPRRSRCVVALAALRAAPRRAGAARTAVGRGRRGRGGRRSRPGSRRCRGGRRAHRAARRLRRRAAGGRGRGCSAARRRTLEAAAATGLVLELGAAPAGAPVTAGLAEVLRDPGLELRLRAARRVVDRRGRAARPAPAARDGRPRVTRRVLEDGTEVALLHDPAAIPDRGGGRVRRRGGGHRGRQRAPRARGARARSSSCAACGAACSKPPTRSGACSRTSCARPAARRRTNWTTLCATLPPDRLEALRRELALARDELAEIARGLYPGRSSSAGSPARCPHGGPRAGPGDGRFDTQVDGAALPPPVALTAYYVASEALANVAKHARAAQRPARALGGRRRTASCASSTTASAARTPTAAGSAACATASQAVDGELRVVSPPAPAP